MMYWKKTGEKIIKKCKKNNYRIIESYNYNGIEGYVYSYLLQDYKGKNTYITTGDRNYFLIEEYIKKLEK